MSNDFIRRWKNCSAADKQLAVDTYNLINQSRIATMDRLIKELQADPPKLIIGEPLKSQLSK